jgi:hypothetical protein
LRERYSRLCQPAYVLDGPGEGKVPVAPVLLTREVQLSDADATKQDLKSATAKKWLFDRIGAPYGNRTRVSAVKGRRPGPLDEGR